jgi:hypothetical protein
VKPSPWPQGNVRFSTCALNRSVQHRLFWIAFFERSYNKYAIEAAPPLPVQSHEK